jgi:hypothetical protein
MIVTASYTAAIEACQACAVACTDCLTQMAGMKSHNDCPRCCFQCAELCRVTVSLMAAHSRFAGRVAAICAEACSWCAEQCSEHEHDHCKRCAESCAECAEQCRLAAA